MSALSQSGWRQRAACRDHPDPNIFFPYGEPDPAAFAVCDGCPVRQPCLEEALAVSPRFDIGIWGGTTANERRRIRRRLLRVAS